MRCLFPRFWGADKTRKTRDQCRDGLIRKLKSRASDAQPSHNTTPRALKLILQPLSYITHCYIPSRIPDTNALRWTRARVSRNTWICDELTNRPSRPVTRSGSDDLTLRSLTHPSQKRALDHRHRSRRSTSKGRQDMCSIRRLYTGTGTPIKVRHIRIGRNAS